MPRRSLAGTEYAVGAAPAAPSAGFLRQYGGGAGVLGTIDPSGLALAIGGTTGVKIATTSIANLTTEGLLHSFTIPAANASVGAAYRLLVFGTTDNSATAAILTLRLRLGGLAGAAIATFAITTPATSQTNKPWLAEGHIICVTTGASGTWQGLLHVTDQTPTAFGSSNVGVNVPSAAVTRDTTIANDLTLTGQWSAANASNIIRAVGGFGQRLA